MACDDHVGGYEAAAVPDDFSFDIGDLFTNNERSRYADMRRGSGSEVGR